MSDSVSDAIRDIERLLSNAAKAVRGDRGYNASLDIPNTFNNDETEQIRAAWVQRRDAFESDYPGLELAHDELGINDRRISLRFTVQQRRD